MSEDPNQKPPSSHEDGCNHPAGGQRKARKPAAGDDDMNNDIECLARRMAAEKMRLVKDPLGEGLPDDLWRQCIPAARAELDADVLGTGPMSGNTAARDVRAKVQELLAQYTGRRETLMDCTAGGEVDIVIGTDRIVRINIDGVCVMRITAVGDGDVTMSVRDMRLEI